MDSNQSSSGSSLPSACYDAKKACIRLLGEGSFLEGSIIEMEQAEQTGTFLMAEVMEIVIMGDGMVPLAVHNERVKKKPKSPTSIAAAPAAMAAEGKGGLVEQNNVSVNPQPTKYVYDELRRAEIQSLMKDKSIGRQEKLRRMAEIKAKYEDLHSDASSELQPKVNSAPDPQIQSSSPTRAVDRWNRGAVAAVSTNALKQSLTQPKKPDPQPQPTLDNNSAQSTRAASRWNRGAVAAVSTNALKQSLTQPKKPDPQTRPTLNSSAQSTRAASRWNRGAIAAVSSNTFKQSITSKQPTEQPKNINEEDIDDLIRLLRFNDPSLTSLILDGRGFDEASWEGLFDSIEENTHVTELSLVNCNLEDSTVGVLVLALVENETLTSINLSYNEDLTDDTGEGLRKVIKQGNAIVKKINIEGTSISSETADKIQTILDERDDSVILLKLQEARQAKIKALLAFSASSEVEKNNRRLAEEEEEEEDDAHSPEKKRLNRSVSSKNSHKSSDSSVSSGKGRNRRKTNEATPISRSSSQRSTASGSRSSPDKKLQHAVKANMAARQMANLGGDMNHVGKSASQLKELRKQRGECVHCGQKCFSKTMFKTVPLSIPNKVQDGRCLRCDF
ncbi:hypothetical protein QTG54_003738 [Skeletonema marinoi]|uniref:RNI-like protein n=1 Tax=Skeletonema marinoi TaxID=267567 RepID=A0AAD9DH22_9STRA|nr:hypothetical protein QTG54_003738 [Skeletonema marinoi]